MIKAFAILTGTKHSAASRLQGNDVQANFKRATIVFIFLILLLASQKTAAYQIQAQSPMLSSTPPLQPGQDFGVQFEFVNDSPNSVLVTFQLYNATTSETETLANYYFKTQGEQATTLYLPSGCYSPSNNWEIYVYAQGQGASGSFSYSSPFVIDQAPPQLSFMPISGTNLIIVANQQYATINQTNLTTNETVYIETIFTNAGCADSSGYTFTVNLDGTQATGNLDLSGSSAGLYDAPFSPGLLPTGPHSVTFTVNSPSGSTIATATSSFFLASIPTIQTQPLSTNVNLGGTAVFSIMALGVPPPQGQWLFNGSAIPGATNLSYTISSVTTNNAGNYSCTVQNYAGSATSSNAVLNVILPVVSPSIKSLTILPNRNLNLTVTGQPGSNEVVQSSSDLQHWVSQSTNANSTGTISVVLPPPTNNVNFYRIAQ